MPRPAGPDQDPCSGGPVRAPLDCSGPSRLRRSALLARLPQVLLELPAVTLEVLGSFQAALAVTLADKEQRTLVKKLLMSSGAATEDAPAAPGEDRS